MKQIQFETSKVFGVLVMLPDGANRLKVFNDKNPYLSYFVGVETFRNPLPSGYDWQLQGFVSELTDEQKEEVVDISVNDPEYVFNYKSGWFEEGLSYWESFTSLLESLGIEITENYVLLTSEK